jgi:hypothetical protein
VTEITITGDRGCSVKGCFLVFIGILIGVVGLLLLLILLKPKTGYSAEAPAGTPDVTVKAYEPYLNYQLQDVLSRQFSNYVESSSLDVKPNRLILVTIQAKIPQELKGKGIIGSIAGIVSQVQGGHATLQVDLRVSVSGRKFLVKVEGIKLGRLPVQR